jgi:hypothetical protein
MALEGASFRGKLTDGAEAEHLESAAVCEDGTVPAFETVKSAGLLQYIQSRAEVQVIGIAEDNLCLHVILQVFMINPFHRTDGTDRHEDRGTDVPVIRMQHTAPGGGRKVGMRLFEFHLSKIIKIEEKMTKFVS